MRVAGIPLGVGNLTASGVGNLTASKTLALLHFDGADESTIIVDSSSYNNTFTAQNGAKISTDQAKFGGSSLYTTAGGNNYCSVVCNRPDGFFDLADSDFTAEIWFYTSLVGWSKNIYAITDSATSILPCDAYLTDGKIRGRVQLDSDNSLVIIEHQNSYLLGSWNHFAAVRHGNNFKVYLNGIGSIATENIGNSLLKTGATELRVGGSTNGITGYCDEFRLRKEAVYLNDFVPPTAHLGVDPTNQAYFIDVDFTALPLTDKTSRHTISSPAEVTIITGGANYDGGASTYSTVSGNDSDFNWSGDFYVVGVFTPTDLSGYRSLWDTHEGLGYDSSQRFGLYSSSDGTLNLYNSGLTRASTIAGVLSVGVPAKIEVFREGTHCHLKVNDVEYLDFEFLDTLSHADRRMYIGGSAYSASQFKGIIHSFKTLGKRTSVLTLPFSSSVIYDIEGNTWVNKYDNAVIADNAMYTGTSGVAGVFNSVGSLLAIGLADFEIGVTVKLDSIPSVGSVLFDCFRSTLHGGEGFQLYVYSSGVLSFYQKNSPLNEVKSSSSVITTGSYIEVKATRIAGVVRLYVNNTQVATGSMNIAFDSDWTAIGYQYFDFGNGYYPSRGYFRNAYAKLL